jgi:hypothetical protein
MGDNTGGKNESRFLRRNVNRSQQTTSSDSGPAHLGMNRDLTHSRQVDHQATVAGAESCEAMPSTTDRGWNPDGAGTSDCALYIAHIEAPRN